MKKHPFDQEKYDDDFEEDQQVGSPKKGTGEFARLLEESFSHQPQKKLSVGDKIRGELLAVGGDDVFFSLGTSPTGMPLDGTASKRELSDPEGKFLHKVGETLDLYVTKIKGGKILVSPKAMAKTQAEDLEDAYRTGLPIEGRVTESCKGGARVSIRGKTAFCPISQLDLAHVANVEDHIGEKYEFVITQLSEGGRNIVVSRRKLLQAQRSLSQGAFTKEHGEGSVVSGKIKKIEAFGAFVEIAPGVEGLLHVSEMSWSRVNNPQDVVYLGQEVMVKIIKMENKEGRPRISLSMKQATAEPWTNVSDSVRVGQIANGKVVRCLKFGAFVEIAPGIEGLIPLSEMSYTKRVVRSDELFKEGERIAVMVKEINPETKRILLSLKDAGSDPWVLVPQKFPVGAVVSGKVDRREVYGLFIELEEGVTGLLHKSKSQDNPEFPYDKLKTGETVMVQIGELDLEERRISLNVPKDPDQDEWKKHVSTVTDGTKAKLADKFKNIIIKKK